MHFAAPALYAWFFSLAAIPAVIYLIFRRKRRDVPWGAIYILRRALEKQSRSGAWKMYAIIALRTLALIALPLAFLAPYLEWRPPEEGAFPTAPASTHRLILLDVSRSMEASCRGGTRLDSAVSFCRKVLQAGRSPGRVDILPLDGRETPLEAVALPPASHAVETVLGEIRLSDAPLDFEAGLRSAMRILRASPCSRKELFILSDFSAPDLQQPEELRGPLGRLRDMGVRVFALSYESAETRNFALLDMSPGVELLLAGQPTILYVRLGYYGTAATADTWLTIRTQDNETLFDEAVTLAQGEKTLEIPITLKGPRATLTAALKDDELTSDNRLQRSYDVSAKLELAVIQDINLAAGLKNPREWLRLAMEAGTSARKPIRGLEDAEQGPAKAAEPETYRTLVQFGVTSQAGAELLAGKDGVIWLDADTAAEDAVEAARQYAVRGGTVLLAPGPVADPKKFNDTFKPLLPAPLGPPARSQIDPEAYDHAVLERGQQRVLRELEAPQHGNIGAARFYNHYQVEPETVAAETEVWFSLSDGSPLLLARRMGRGLCLLWTAGLGGEWHSMGVHAVYPVFFSRLLNLAAAGSRHPLNLVPGEPLVCETGPGEAKLCLPDGHEIMLRPSVVGQRRLVRFDRTTQPGAYTVYPNPDSPTQRIVFHVAEDRRESDYRPISGEPRRLLETLMGAPFYLAEPDVVFAVGAEYRGTQLASSAALAALAALLLAAWLARRWFA